MDVAMLTGDSEDIANAAADELGIDTVFAEVLPEDKDTRVSELQEEVLDETEPPDETRLVRLLGFVNRLIKLIFR